MKQKSKLRECNIILEFGIDILRQDKTNTQWKTTFFNCVYAVEFYYIFLTDFSIMSQIHYSKIQCNLQHYNKVLYIFQ